VNLTIIDEWRSLKGHCLKLICQDPYMQLC